MKTAITASVFLLVASAAHADPMTCDVTAYRVVAGMSATAAGDALTVVWRQKVWLATTHGRRMAKPDD